MKKLQKIAICAAAITMLVGIGNSALAQDVMREVNVKIRILVHASGKVLKCELIRTSGRPALDQAACRGVERHGAKPSLDENGSPTDSCRIEEISYSVPK